MTVAGLFSRVMFILFAAGMIICPAICYLDPDWRQAFVPSVILATFGLYNAACGYLSVEKWAPWGGDL